MALCVCMGAGLACSFGAAPSSLCVLPQARVMAGGMPMASIADTVPGMNIPPFGVCSSPANPTVAAATAAAMGVLTPMPCLPVPAGMWLPGSPQILVGGKPALTNSSMLMCGYGGVISITAPGQGTVLCG